MIIIENTESRMVGIGNSLGSKVILRPGINQVDEIAWGQVRKNVKKKLAKGTLKEYSVKVEKEIIEKPNPLKPEETVEVETGIYEISGKDFKAFKDEEKLDFVKNTFNIELLKTWKKLDLKNVVTVAIDDQIKLIENHGEDKKPKESND